MLRFTPLYVVKSYSELKLPDQEQHELYHHHS